jgi:molybdate transport system substrate-binding protein
MCRLAIAAGLLLLGTAVPCHAAEIRVIAGGALEGIINDLTPSFEMRSGHKVTLRAGATGTMRRDIEAGTPFDLALLDCPVIEALVKQGKVAEDSLTPFARVGMGLGVRAGAAKPIIDTVDRLKSALLSAASIAYVPVGNHLPTVFKRLNITTEMQAKSMRQPNAAAAARAVAIGEAEIVLAVSNYVVTVKGVELAGSFPDELQYWMVVTAGMARDTKNAGAVHAFLQHLRTPEAAAVIRERGMEPTGG